jgi:hypothetical protein
VLFDAYGLLVSVQGPEIAMADIRSRLPPTYGPGRGEPTRNWTIDLGDDDRWRVTVDGDSLGARAEMDAAVGALLSDLELWVGANAQDRIFVHAGCVVHRGRAIILPGRSMAGKTTLTLALVEAGARYYSDEYAVLDAEGRAHPYRRRPAVRQSSPYAGHSLAPEATDDPAEPAPVGISALLRYQPDTDWDVDEVTSAAGVLHLMSNTLAARTRTVEALSTFAQLSGAAVFHTGTRGESNQAAQRLLAVLDD